MVTYFHDSFRLILVLRNSSVHCLILLLLTCIFIIIIIIIEFLTSQDLLGNIHLHWDVVINRIMFGGLICSLKTFLHLNMCQELQFFRGTYVFWCRLSLVRLCDSDFGITPVGDITIGIISAAFCFHRVHFVFVSS